MGGDILFLVHRAPWPPDRGDRIRSWHLFQALRAIAPVHVIALADDAREAESARAKLEPLAASCTIAVRGVGRGRAMIEALVRRQPASLPLFANAKLSAHTRALLDGGTIGHIVVFSSQMAQYVPTDCAIPFTMDFVDVDSAKFEAYAAEDRSGPMRWVHAREGRLLAGYEAEVAARAGASLFVSEAEAALFRTRCPVDPTRIVALENGIDLDRFSPAGDWLALEPHERGGGPLAAFTGQMDYRPNIDAVTGFARDTMPRLRAIVPDAQFAIVGRGAPDEVHALADLPGVVVTGSVPDTRPWIAAADVVVAPLRTARGVQNKLLEAMAMARPVVASSSAAQGIDVEDGIHLIVADEPDATATAVARLMRDGAVAAALGAQARRRMVERYGWDATLAPLAAILAGGKPRCSAM